MNSKVKLTSRNIEQLAYSVFDKLKDFCKERDLTYWQLKAYPIPRGGVPAAYAIKSYALFTIVESAEEADIFIDDIIDSGATLERYAFEYPGKPMFALIDKTDPDCPPEYKDAWIVFPWERDEKDADHSATDNIVRLLQNIGEDPTREGLLETPTRVMKAWKHWASGYGADIAGILKVFEDGAENYSQPVVVRGIPIYSKCEHHLADIFGTATIAYIPDGRIVGLSKLSRVADVFARRLQVQERLTSQIADSLHEHLQPKGVAVIIKARHFCMESRGICQQGHDTVTTAFHGEYLTDPHLRAEFMALSK